MRRRRSSHPLLYCLLVFCADLQGLVFSKVHKDVPGATSWILHDIHEDDLLFTTGMLCDYTAYDAGYDHATTSADIRTNASSKYQWVLVGARRSRWDGNFKIASIGLAKVVLSRTNSTSRALNGGGDGHWYNVPGYSFGFAESPEIRLAYADMHSNCTNRMSWHLDNFKGGWSMGCSLGHYNKESRKVVKYCNSVGLRGTGFIQYLTNRYFITRISTCNVSGSNFALLRIGTSGTYDASKVRSFASTALIRIYQHSLDWVNSRMLDGNVSIAGEQRQIEMTMIDDHDNPAQARLATQYLTQTANVRVLVGPYGMQLVEQAAAVANASGALMVAPSEVDHNVIKDQPQNFAVMPQADESFASVLAELSRRGAKTIGIMQEKQYPPAACNGVVTLAAVNGMSVLFKFIIAAPDNIGAGVTNEEIEGLFVRIDSKKPDVLIACAYFRIVQRFYREYITRRTEVSALVLTGSIVATQFLSEFGEDARFVMSVRPQPLIPSAGINRTIADIALSYASIHPRNSWTPTWQLKAGAAALQVIYLSMMETSSQDPAILARAIRNRTFQTILGDIHFDENGLCDNLHWQAVQFLPGNYTLQEVAPLQDGSQSMAYPIPPWKLRPCFQHRDNLCGVGLTRVVTSSDSSFYVCGPCLKDNLAIWLPNAWHGIAACSCLEAIEAIDCLEGHVPHVDDPSACVPCPPGRHGIIDGVLCHDCKRGTFTSLHGQSACAVCPAGRFANETKMSACHLCNRGFSSNHGDDSCHSCWRGTFANQVGSTHCSLCEAGKTAENRGTTQCISCTPGRHSVWGGKECLDCSPGRFQSAAGMSTCTECPVGSMCPHAGQTRIWSNEPNWWFLNVDTGSLPCMRENMCLAEERCREGHTGMFCNVCLPDYARNKDWEHCFKCRNLSENLVFAGFGGLFIVSLVLVTTNLAVESAGQIKSVTDALFKLLVNYFVSITFSAQIFQKVYQHNLLKKAKVTGKLEGPLPSTLMYILEFNIGEILRLLIGFDCLFGRVLEPEDQQWVEILKNANHSEISQSGAVQQAREKLVDYHRVLALRQMVVWLSAPVVLVCAVVFLAWVILLFKLNFHRRRTKRIIDFRDRGKEAIRDMHTDKMLSVIRARDYRVLGLYNLVDYSEYPYDEFFAHFVSDSSPIVVVATFFLYPNMVDTFSAPLHCYSPYEAHEGIGDDRMWMTRAPDLECYQADDLLFQLSLVGLVIFVLGVPLVGSWILCRNQHNLSMRYKRMWGFVTNGYEVEWNYWECLSLFRKALCVLIATIGMPSGIRALLFMILASLSALAHLRCRPFDNRYNELLDRVEGRHLIVWCIFTIAIYWVYLDGEDSYKIERDHGGMSHESGNAAYATLTIVVIVHIVFLLMVFRLLIIHGATDYAFRLVDREKQAEKLTDEVRSDFNREPSAPYVAKRQSMSAMVSSYSKTVFSALDVKHRRAFEHFMFGNWAERQVDHYLEYKAHLFGFSGSNLFELMGNHSHHLARTAPRLPKHPLWHETHRDCNSPTEKQRRYLLDVFHEVFSLMIEFHQISLFSPTLLEFVIRAGYAFDQHANPRLDEFVGPGATENRPSMSKSQSSLSSSDNKQKRISMSGSRGSGRQSQSAMMRVFKQMNRQCPSLGFSSEQILPEDKIEEYVQKMMQPDLFEVALSIEEFDLHLGFLREIPKESLQKWMCIFEEAWEAKVYRNLKDAEDREIEEALPPEEEELSDSESEPGELSSDAVGPADIKVSFSSPTFSIEDYEAEKALTRPSYLKFRAEQAAAIHECEAQSIKEPRPSTPFVTTTATESGSEYDINKLFQDFSFDDKVAENTVLAGHNLQRREIVELEQARARMLREVHLGHRMPSDVALLSSQRKHKPEVTSTPLPKKRRRKKMCDHSTQADSRRGQLEVPFHVEQRWGRMAIEIAMHSNVKISKAMGMMGLTRMAQRQRQEEERLDEVKVSVAQTRANQASKFSKMMAAENQRRELLTLHQNLLKEESEANALLRVELHHLRELLKENPKVQQADLSIRAVSAEHTDQLPTQASGTRVDRIDPRKQIRSSDFAAAETGEEESKPQVTDLPRQASRSRRSCKLDCLERDKESFDGPFAQVQEEQRNVTRMDI